MIKTGRIEFYDRPTAWGLILGDDQELYVVRGRDGRGALLRVGERVEETLDRADEALYEAKRTGKNRTCIA